MFIRKEFGLQKGTPKTPVKNMSLWVLYKRHMNLLREIYPTAYWAYLIFGVSTYLFYPFAINFSAKFINSVVSYYQSPIYTDLLLWHIPTPVYYAFLWFGIWIFGKIVSFLRDMYEALLWVAVYHGGVYKLILKKFYDLNLEEIQQNEIFEALSRFTQYWFSQARTIHKDTVNFIGAIISLLLTFWVMANEGGHYGLVWFIVGAALLPLVSSLALYLQDKLYRRFIKTETEKFRLRDYLVSVLLDSKTFLEKKVNNIYKRLISKYENLEDKIKRDKKKNWSRHDIVIGIFNAFEYYLFVLLKILLVTDSITHKVKVGTITGNLTFLNNIYTKVKSLLNNWASIIGSLRYTRDLFAILSIQGFANTGSLNAPVPLYKNKKSLNKLIYSQGPMKAPVLEFRKLSFKFPDTDYIFKNVSMKVNLGDTIFIYGKDGSGKSAFVKILTASFKLPENSYFILGKPVEKYKRHSVKQLFALSGEYFDRYFFSLKENILLGSSSDKVDKNLFEKALHIADLLNWAKQNKLLNSNKPLGKFFAQGVAVPSGIWQRLSIARAIYLNRPILLCDMCFTYIDQEARNTIIKRLIRYIKQENKVLIFITEDLDFVHLFDKLFIKTPTRLYEISLEDLGGRTDIR